MRPSPHTARTLTNYISGYMSWFRWGCMGGTLTEVRAEGALGGGGCKASRATAGGRRSV